MNFNPWDVCYLLDSEASGSVKLALGYVFARNNANRTVEASWREFVFTVVHPSSGFSTKRADAFVDVTIVRVPPLDEGDDSTLAVGFYVVDFTHTNLAASQCLRIDAQMSIIALCLE